MGFVCSSQRCGSLTWAAVLLALSVSSRVSVWLKSRKCVAESVTTSFHTKRVNIPSTPPTGSGTPRRLFSVALVPQPKCVAVGVPRLVGIRTDAGHPRHPPPTPTQIQKLSSWHSAYRGRQPAPRTPAALRTQQWTEIPSCSWRIRSTADTAQARSQVAVHSQ